MDLSNFRVEPASLKEASVIPFGEDSSISILQFKNRDFLNYFSRLQKPHLKAIEDDTADESLTRSLLARAMAEKMVVSWTNLRLPWDMFQEEFPAIAKKVKGADKFKDDDKVAIPYSKEHCFQVLNHENYDEFRGWIVIQSRARSNFLDGDMESDLGN